jgi:alcohol dehydrogenase
MKEQISAPTITALAGSPRSPKSMRAAVFVEPGRIELREKPVPTPGPTDALIRITMTTICGTDVHILKGEYPVASGLTVGHEPVGVIAALGSAVTGYRVGQRVIAGAITPCGQCHSCLDGHSAQCGGKAIGGWRFGNTIDGCQAEYVLVPNAMANLALIPDELTDEQVLMCPDIMSTGFGGAESGRIRIGDTVAVFAQGPIGLCATVGARLSGAARIFAVDMVPGRLEMSKRLGADTVIDGKQGDAVQRILDATRGRGAFEPRSLFGQVELAAGCLRGRPGGPHDRLDVVPRGQGTHAPPDEHRGLRKSGSTSSGNPPVPARSDRTGLRPFRPPTGRRAQSGDRALKQSHETERREV